MKRAVLVGLPVGVVLLAACRPDTPIEQAPPDAAINARIQQLIAQLDEPSGSWGPYCMPSKDPTDYVAVEIRKIGNPAVPALINALDDGDQERRLWAISLLGAIGSKSATEPLLRHLPSANKTEKLWIVDSLGKLKDNRAIPVLMQMLTEEPGSESYGMGMIDKPGKQSATALAAIGDDALAPLLAVAKDKSTNIRANAICALGSFNDKHAREAVTQALSDSEAKVRLQAVEVCRESDFPNTAEVLIGLLSDISHDVRWEAQVKLGEMGKRAIPALRKAIADRNPNTRAVALELLADVGDVSRERTFLSLLSDETAYVRSNAIRALDSSSAKRYAKQLLRALGDPDRDVRIAAVAALGEGSVNEAGPRLLRMLNDDDEFMRETVAEALGGVKEKRAFQPLLKMLNDKSKGIVAAGCRGLGKLLDKRALPAIWKLTKDADVGADAYLAVRRIQRQNASYNGP